MTRTVTAAVAELHNATRHVDRGDFSHRIPIRSNDQLSDLALSFNSMTASIEKLILEQKEKQRLENELTIAQEVQAQLFPRQISQLESLEVHGFCRPARTVSGDYYDFLTASSHKLILAVGDISGKGISAALLMATIHSAVRAYSVESLPQMREPVAVGAVGGVGRVMATWPEGIEVSPGALLGLLESSTLRQHSAGEVRHPVPGNLRRPLAPPDLQQRRPSAPDPDRQRRRRAKTRGRRHGGWTLRQYVVRRRFGAIASRRDLRGLQRRCHRTGERLWRIRRAAPDRSRAQQPAPALAADQPDRDHGRR